MRKALCRTSGTRSAPIAKEASLKPRVKSGLIAGSIGLILNACVSAAVGLWGPFLALLAGAAAGFLAAQAEKPSNQADGARLGAVAGGIAGALTLVGQLLGGTGALVLFQRAGISLPLGTIPSLSEDVSRQLMYYISGLGLGACLGLVGVALAALGGAGAGYLGTPVRGSEQNDQVQDRD